MKRKVKQKSQWSHNVLYIKIIMKVASSFNFFFRSRRIFKFLVTTNHESGSIFETEVITFTNISVKTIKQCIYLCKHVITFTNISVKTIKQCIYLCKHVITFTNISVKTIKQCIFLCKHVLSFYL